MKKFSGIRSLFKFGPTQEELAKATATVQSILNEENPAESLEAKLESEYEREQTLKSINTLSKTQDTEQKELFRDLLLSEDIAQTLHIHGEGYRVVGLYRMLDIKDQIEALNTHPVAFADMTHDELGHTSLYGMIRNIKEQDPTFSTSSASEFYNELQTHENSGAPINSGDLWELTR